MNESRLTDQFVKRYSPLVYTAIERRLKGYGFNLPRDEILDIQQDVFTSIHENNKLDTINNAGSIPYWIAIVSGNAAMQYMRKRRRIELDQKVSIFDKMDGLEMAETIPSPALNPSEELNRAELSKRMNEAMEALQPKEKLIIKLNLLHNKKYEEISDMLNIPAGTVSNYIKRAKEKLRKDLKEFE